VALIRNDLALASTMASSNTFLGIDYFSRSNTLQLQLLGSV